jgi:uncharacterized protein with LGFP repeats
LEKNGIATQKEANKVARKHQVCFAQMPAKYYENEEMQFLYMWDAKTLDNNYYMRELARLKEY